MAIRSICVSDLSDNEIPESDIVTIFVELPTGRVITSQISMSELEGAVETDPAFGKLVMNG